METNKKVNTISEYHRLRGFAEPAHPLISLVNLASVAPERSVTSVVINFFSICIKRSSNIQLKYGQQEYDFNSGVMFFMSPGQVFSLYANANEKPEQSGWLLLIHPDFFWNTPLSKRMKQFEFFNYSVNEALFLSEKEKTTINGIIACIEQEYHSNIDKFSKQIIISHVDLRAGHEFNRSPT